MFESARSISLTPSSAVLNQYRFVELGAQGNAFQAAAGTDPVGISLESAPANSTSAVSIAILDGAILEVEASASIAIGDNITSAASGQAVTAGTGSPILGKALTAAATQGDIISFISAKAGRVV